MRRLGLLLVVVLLAMAPAACGDDDGGGDDGETAAVPSPLLTVVVEDVQALLLEVEVSSTLEAQEPCLRRTSEPVARLTLDAGAVGRGQIVAHLRSYGWSPVEGVEAEPGEAALVRRYRVEPSAEDGAAEVEPRVVEATLTLRGDEAVVQVVDPPPCG